jgi:hypothetical protein
MGFPVVLKIVSPEILHKTKRACWSACGRLGTSKGRDDHGQREEYDAKVNLMGARWADADGCQEVIVGAVTDPSFGKPSRSAWAARRG